MHKQSIFISLLLLMVLIFTQSFTACSPQDFSADLLEMGYQTAETLPEYHTENIIQVFLSDSGEFIQVVQIKGYHRGLVFTVVIKDKMVRDVVVINHNESHDYGIYVTESWFLERLYTTTDKPLVLRKLIKEADNEVVAITGATITSQAVVDGVNMCLTNYTRYQNEE